MREWRDIPGYEGWYQVSNDGLVRSLDRLDARGYRRFSRLMKPSGVQHKWVRLTKDCVAKTPLIHRMMLMAFVAPPPFEGAMGLHSDGNYLNNTIGNLRWGSVQDNHDDAEKHGSFGPNWNGAVTTTLHDYDRVTDLKRQGFSGHAIARWLGLDKKTVPAILRRGRAFYEAIVPPLNQLAVLN